MHRRHNPAHYPRCLGKIDTFISFVLISILLGIASGMNVSQITHTMEKGIGDILGSLVIILGFGAMLGRLVAESGTAQQITHSLTNLFGKKYLPWGMSPAGLIIGIPLFYTAGFVAEDGIFSTNFLAKTTLQIYIKLSNGTLFCRYCKTAY